MSFRPLKLFGATLNPYSSPPFADFSNFSNVKLSNTIDSNSLLPANLIATNDMLNEKVSELNEQGKMLIVSINNGLYLDTNNITVKYSNTSITTGLIPTFIYANVRDTDKEWFAVVDQSFKQKITDYANNDAAAISLFTPSGQSSAVPFNNIVTSLMTDMSMLFANASSFNQPIGSWDTSNVTDMSFMFNEALVFNQNISGWNVTLVTPNPPTNFSTSSPLTSANSPF